MPAPRHLERFDLSAAGREIYHDFADALRRAPCAVTITNTGSSNLVVTGLAITGDFQVNPNVCTTPIPSLASCTIQVYFDPILPGTRTGTLIISGNGTAMPATITLTGTAGATSTLCAGTGPCTVPPASVTFAGTNVSVTSPAQVATLANLSKFPFNVQSVVITGAAPGDFTQTNNCGTSVSALSSCTISISFTPTATGNRNATLTVTSDAAASPQSVSIIGVGTAPAVTLAPPTSLTFPKQPLNAPSIAMPITLSNAGTGPLNISAGGLYDYGHGGW